MSAALTDPVPVDLVDQCIALGSWLDMDHALAELTHHSLSTDIAAGVRSDADEIASYTFETTHTVVEIELDPRRRELTGQLLPAAQATVSLETPDDTVGTTATDGHGVFRLSHVPAGPISLVVTISGEHDTVSIRTRWIVV